jgi:hypothetical protein
MPIRPKSPNSSRQRIQKDDQYRPRSPVDLDALATTHLPKTDTEPSAGSQAPYEVGYGRPPKHSQFRKGQSGNPSGRRRANKDLRTLIRENLLAKISVRTEAGMTSMTRIEAIIRKLLEEALKGNQRAATKLLDLFDVAVPPANDGAAEEEQAATATDDAILNDFLNMFGSQEGLGS